MKRGQVSVPSEVFDRWTAIAWQRGISVRELVEQACGEISTVPVQLSPEVVRRLEAHAAKQGLTVQTVVEFALTKLIRRCEGAACCDCEAEKAF